MKLTLLFIYIFSIESIAQTYPNLDKTNDEQPLNDRVCNRSNINGNIEKKFGNDVSSIVNSLTKLTADENTLIENLDQKNMRRFLVSVAKDVRVMIIKLADRLHKVENLK